MADEECVSACLQAEQLRWKRREEEKEEEEELERWNEDGLKKGEKSARERERESKKWKIHAVKKRFPTFIDLPQGKVLSTDMPLDEKKTLVSFF